MLISTILLPLCRAADIDEDGLPDDWENQYFGNLSQGPSDDFDHDGLNNLQEYHDGQNSSDPTSPFSGGRVKATWTYTYPFPGQMIPGKITELMNDGINTFILNDYGPYVDYQNLSENNSLFDLIGPDPDAPYIIQYYQGGYPYSARVTVKEKAALAKQYGFAYFQTISFDYNPFPNNNFIQGAFPVVYSDGTAGKQISPFCEAYWQRLTKMVRSLAYLPIRYPDLYRIDGVTFDFELYGQEELHRDTYFNETWGFENQTFDAYCESRHLNNPHPPLADRFSWLEQQHLITVDSNGFHQGDYYIFLSDLIRGYATTMREEVKAVNPKFLLGAYPSPVGFQSSHRYYLPEIFSGWSTRTEPAVVWATEMYGGGSADNLPENLSNVKLDEGYYNLTTLYPSFTSNDNPIFGYYVAGVLSRCYFSGNFGYHLYQLAVPTNGYWIFTTYGFTEDLHNLTQGYRSFYYDRTQNIVYDSIYNSTDTPCNNDETYRSGAQDYYNQMALMNSELSNYFNQYPDYQTTLAKVSPPLPLTIYSHVPDTMTIPNDSLTTLTAPTGIPYNLPEPKLRFISQHNFVFSASEGQQVTFGFLTYLWSHLYNVKAAVAYAIDATNGTTLTCGLLDRPTDPYYDSYTGVPSTLHFTAPYTGIYFLRIDPDESCFEITQTNVPLALYKPYRQTTPDHPLNDADYIRLIDMYADSWNRVYNLYFFVKNGTTSFAIDFKGYQTSEGLHATISKPITGGHQPVISGETSVGQNVFTLNVSVPTDSTNKIWKLALSKPLNGQQAFGYMNIRFDQSIDPYFGLTDNLSYFMRVNHAPLIRNDSFTVEKNSENNQLQVLTNDYDPDGDSFQIVGCSQPIHGNISIINNGLAILYTPLNDFVGQDEFTYYTTDGFECSTNATVSLQVQTSRENPPSDPPVGSTSPSYFPENILKNNTPPVTPMAPTGPRFIERGIEYTYSTFTTDLDGDRLRYRFNWDDGNISSWSEFYTENTTMNCTHHWEMAGTFNILCQAQDEHGANSSWSDPLEMTVSQEESNGQLPIINITLPTIIPVYQTVVFNASDCYDPDGVIVLYLWDFGDGTYGSGKSVSHQYSAPGEYNITLQVIDNTGNHVSKTLHILCSQMQGVPARDRLIPFFGIFLIVGGVIFTILFALIMSPRRRIQRISRKINKIKTH
jgi:hypothetical protein